MKKSREVDAYVDKQGSPQKDICERLRRIILETFPGIDESVKMGVPWYGKFYIVGLKDSVNLGFSVQGLSKEDMDNFKGKGKLMRHLKFRDVKEIDVKEITRLLKMVDEKAACGSCIK